jgi:hypothetical protein
VVFQRIVIEERLIVSYLLALLVSIPVLVTFPWYKRLEREYVDLVLPRISNERTRKQISMFLWFPTMVMSEILKKKHAIGDGELEKRRLVLMRFWWTYSVGCFVSFGLVVYGMIQAGLFEKY